MRITIKPEIDTATIITRHNMAPGSQAELFLATEVKRHCGPYVPRDQGILATTALVSPGKVEYITPYAKRQYYEHKGAGQRGPHWEKRMLAQRKEALVSAMSKFLGGRTG